MMKLDSWVLKYIHNYSEWYLVVGKLAVSFRKLADRRLSHVSWCTCNVSWATCNVSWATELGSGPPRAKIHEPSLKFRSILLQSSGRKGQES